MEPVTHVLTGACLARAGFNRRAAYATLTMAIAAEMPDIDTLWGLRGPVEGFAHHRGITHTLVGVPLEAAVLLGAVYGLHQWRVTRAARLRIGPKFSNRPLTKAPVRWGWLYGCAVVALLSHLLLDFTNNYGVRPLYPFDTHWYAASIAFIFDPVMFGLLVLALVVPSLFGLVSAEVGAKRQVFRGRGLAIAALACIGCWWGLRYVEHARAVAIAMVQSYEQAQAPVAAPVVAAETPADAADAAGSDAATTEPATAADGSVAAASGEAATATVAQPAEMVQPEPVVLSVQRALASPSPVNPFRWSVAMDYGPLIQLATMDARSGAMTTSEVTYTKPQRDAVIAAAEASSLGRVYLDWSEMPIVTEEEPAVGATPATARKVTLRDARFMGEDMLQMLTGTTPLTAVVTVNAEGRVVRQALDGRVQRHFPVLMTDLSRP